MEGQNQNNMVSADSKNIQQNKLNIDVLFSGDSYGLFVFKKTERLVTAIYLLTGVMADAEPMKGKLRAIATDMLSTALSMSDRVWGEDLFQKNLSNALCEMTVLFDVALTAQMISTMNHQIITDELKKLTNFLLESSANYSSAKIAVPQNFFEGDYNFAPTDIYQIKKADTIKPVIAEQPAFFQGQNPIKDNQKIELPAEMSEIKVSKENKPIKDKNNRQEIILAMLKGGAKLTIKDFAKNIKGCSDKTIQRELIAMVAKGVLKKEGERRWSKYFLA